MVTYELFVPIYSFLYLLLLPLSLNLLYLRVLPDLISLDPLEIFKLLLLHLVVLSHFDLTELCVLLALLILLQFFLQLLELLFDFLLSVFRYFLNYFQSVFCLVQFRHSWPLGHRVSCLRLHPLATHATTRLYSLIIAPPVSDPSPQWFHGAELVRWPIDTVVLPACLAILVSHLLLECQLLQQLSACTSGTNASCDLLNRLTDFILVACPKYTIRRHLNAQILILPSPILHLSHFLVVMELVHASWLECTRTVQFKLRVCVW